MPKKNKQFSDLLGLAGRMKTVRLKHQLGRANIGELVGVTEGTVRGWESAKYEPPLCYLEILVKELGCDLNWLFLGREIIDEASMQSEREEKLLLENNQLKTDNCQLMRDICILSRENMEIRNENKEIKKEKEVGQR